MIFVNVFSPGISPPYDFLPFCLEEDWCAIEIKTIVYNFLKNNLSQEDIKYEDVKILSLPQPTPLAPYNTLINRISDIAHTAEEPDPQARIKDNVGWYQSGSVQVILKIISQHPKHDAEKEHLAALNQARLARTPSSVANNVKTFQTEQRENPVYNGRPDTLRGTPVSIYHKSLALLKDGLENLHINTVERHRLDLTGKLFLASTEIYDTESRRKDSVYKLLESLLDVKFRRLARVTEGNRKTAEADALVEEEVQDPNFVGHRAVLVEVEIKNEMGVHGDSSLQAALTYRKYIAQPQYEKIRNVTCCPAVIISIAGPYMQISAAILVDTFIVQPLTDFIYLGGNPHSQGKITYVAKIFGVVARAISNLKQFYRILRFSRERISARLLPNPTILSPEPTHAVDTIEFHCRFRYPGRQSDDFRCSLFLATYQNKPVVVKFVEKYGEAAHKKLAETGLAPALHMCCRIAGNLYMVVMDLVQGEDAFQKFQGLKLPPTVMSDIEQAVSILHSEGFVFGDLRRPNIMVVPKPVTECATTDPLSQDLRGMLIDFDSAGPDGQAEYSALLNDTGEIDWAEGVSPGGIMRQQHDVDMLKKLNLF